MAPRGMKKEKKEKKEKSSFVRFPCKTINHPSPSPPPFPSGLTTTVNVCFWRLPSFLEGGEREREREKKKEKYGFISLRSGLINIS